MKHILDEDFENCRAELPKRMQERVLEKIAILRQNPRYPSLRLKKVGKLWSIRINQGYRALAREEDTTLVWFWVGPHDAYQRHIRRYI